MGLIDKTEAEKKALEHAGQMAGEHIETLPSTDMARWTMEQWETHIETVVAAFVDKMGELSKVEAPF